MRRQLALARPTTASHASGHTTHLVLALMAGIAIGGRTSVSGSALPDAVLSAGFGGTLIWLAMHDAVTRLIPNWVVYPAAVLALALSWAWDTRGPVEVITGGTLAFGGIAALGWLARGGLGGGDLKMGTLVGLVVGYSNLPLAAAVTVLSGGVAAIALLAAGRVARSGSIAYAPFIALGGVVALLI